MDIHLHLKYFLLVLLTTEGTCQLACPKPKGNNCSPSDRPPLTCATQVVDGSGLTWFNMEENCAKVDGRLVWLKDKYTSANLVTTEKTLNRTSLNATNFIVLGLLQSMKGDDLTFWVNPTDNKTMTCGSQETDICLSSPTTQKHCHSIGCCWVNAKCQYPEHQLLAEYNASTAVDTSAVSTTGRHCVGLLRNGTTWSLKAFKCSSPAVAGTGYICEYKCTKDWQNVTLQTVSWARNASATISASTGILRTSTSIDTGTGRNKTRNVFDKQVMLTAYIALISLTYYARSIVF